MSWSRSKVKVMSHGRVRKNPVAVPRLDPGGVQAPKSWLGPKFSRPPNSGQASKFSLLLTDCGPLVLRKINKFDANRCG